MSLIELNWVGLSGLDWNEISCELGWVELGCGLDWVMGRIGLHWVGLDWVLIGLS